MMADLMGLFLELMINAIVLIMQPCSLLKLMCLCGLRSICLVTHTLLQLPKAVISFHMHILWKVMIWTVAFVSLPVRILTALHRERLLETHLQEMQIELENLAWYRKQLDERLQIAMKERSIMASVLDELEEEHEKAISKIELLEIELQDLKDENLYLKETNEKGKWDSKSKDDHYSYGDEIHEYDVPLLKSGYKGSGIIIKDHLTHKDAWEDENKGKIQPQDLLKLETKGSGLRYSLSETITPDSLRVAEAHDRCRDVALSQSLFSATLSLLVGVIIWTAEDPCMPLVVALFTVVGMSLKSVVQFFSSLKNRPASEAVALLSFNWFILGTLTYPTLPSVADIMIPRTLRLADRIIVWLGLSSLLQME